MGYVASIISGTFLILCIVGYIKTKNILRQVLELPTSTPGSAAMGLAEIYGKTTNKNIQNHPLSGEPCAYYLITNFKSQPVFKSPGNLTLGGPSGTATIDMRSIQFLMTNATIWFPPEEEIKKLPHFKQDIIRQSMESSNQTYRIKTIDRNHPLFQHMKVMGLYDITIKEQDTIYALGMATSKEGQTFITKNGILRKILLSDRSERWVTKNLTFQKRLLLVLITLFAIIFLISNIPFIT